MYHNLDPIRRIATNPTMPAAIFTRAMYIEALPSLTELCVALELLACLYRALTPINRPVSLRVLIIQAYQAGSPVAALC